jgi:hypothetical protein
MSAFTPPNKFVLPNNGKHRRDLYELLADAVVNTVKLQDQPQAIAPTSKKKKKKIGRNTIVYGAKSND